MGPASNVRLMPNRMLTPKQVEHITGWTYQECCRVCRQYGVRPGKRSLYISPVALDRLLNHPWQIEKERRATL